MPNPSRLHGSAPAVRGLFIDGREVSAAQPEMLDVRNPATGEVIARIPNSTAEPISTAR